MVRTLGCVVVAIIAATFPSIAESQPVFAGVWSAKEPGGVGGLLYDLTWEQLVARWKELGSRQYLANVEAYEVEGQRRYAAAWRIGPGNGALLLSPWDKFLEVWKKLQPSQELIDLEIVPTTNGLRYLGVWREKRGRDQGTGALFVGLSWEQLLARRAELGGAQYLADVETYEVGKTRWFAGVWRIGKGNGALYLLKDWAEFESLKAKLDKSQQMLDFEMYQSDEGEWRFLGVWRGSGSGGPLRASTNQGRFTPLTPRQFVSQWEKLQKSATLVGLTAVVPLPPPLTAFRGNTTCTYGDADCNRCATDVVNQFKWAFETGHRPWIGWHARSWTFSGKTKYPPDGLRPEFAFYPHDKPSDDGAFSKHIQGFVRTNSTQVPYAGSHSHRDVGSIFFIERDGGRNVLRSIYRSNHGHPSGVAVLGDGLFVAEGDGLRRFRVSAAGQDQPTGLITIPKNTAKRGLQNGGGGIGLAKLQDGTTLLIVSAPGGGFRPHLRKVAREDNARDRYTRFYRLVPNVFANGDIASLLGEWKHPTISSRPEGPRGYSENLSVVTECGTGRLYVIHTTGEYESSGNGYWMLSRVEGSGGDARLVHVDTARQRQDIQACHHRSSATVHVNKDGKLEFLCSERAVIKWNPTGRFDFKEGVP